MTKPITHRPTMKCIGEIDPRCLYTTDRVMESIGLGRNSITDGVKAGVIKRLPAGKFCYVRGRDVIAWIEKLAAEKKK